MFLLELCSNTTKEIINFLVENEIFLHLRIRWCSLDFRIAKRFQQEQIVRYTPSEEHRKKCKDDLCHKNARLEFIDLFECVTNSKSFEEEEEHNKECEDDLCDMNAKLEVIDSDGSVFNSKSFEEKEELRKECKDDLCDMNDTLEVIDHRRRITKSFRQKKCTVL